MASRKPNEMSRKVAVGRVTSSKMHKTVTVQVPRFVRHPDYGKVLRRYTDCKAHDEKQEATVGDTVRIVETRPLSKTKRWRLVDIVTRAKGIPKDIRSVVTSAPGPSGSEVGTPGSR